MKRHLSLWAIALCAWTTLAPAQTEKTWTNPTDRWTTLGPPRGALIIAGGASVESIFRRFLQMVGDPAAPIVIIPTAGNGKDLGEENSSYRKLKELGATNLVLLHTRDRAVADSEAFVAPLKKAKGVFISGGFQARLAAAYLHTRTHTELFAVLDRGGIVAGSSAGASIQGSFLYGGGEEQKVGLGFVRDSAIGQHYFRRNRLATVPRILREHRDLLGIGIDEATAIVVQGDQFEVIGDSKVAMYDARPQDWSGERPPELLLPGDRYDLAARRSTPQARVAAAEKWSGASAPWTDPDKAAGRLLFCGGEPGAETLARFVQLAGGPAAPLVVLSTGSESDRLANEKIVAALTRQGAQHVALLHTIDRDRADSTVFAAPLKSASGIWIGGGVKWKFADTYRHTLVHRELFDLAQRGGVIGGHGAGATLLASRLCDAGYRWDQGYGLLPGTVIWEEPLDQTSAKSLKELQTATPGLQAIGLQPGAVFLVEDGRVKTLAEGRKTPVGESNPAEHASK